MKKLLKAPSVWDKAGQQHHQMVTASSSCHMTADNPG